MAEDVVEAGRAIGAPPAPAATGAYGLAAIAGSHGTGTAIGAHPSAEGFDTYGYAYLDSLADTGPTRVPYLAKLEGATGEAWDPCWESLVDLSQPVQIYPVAPRPHSPRPIEEGFVFYSDRLCFTANVNRWLTEEVVETPPPISLEALLAELRSHAGLPVGDLARLLGISRRQFYNWLSGEHAPDRESEERARRTAALLAKAHDRCPEPRLIRAALLAPGKDGSAFDALAAGDLELGSQLLETALARGEAELAAAAGVPLSAEVAERTLLELSHLRDGPRRGDG